MLYFYIIILDIQGCRPESILYYNHRSSATAETQRVSYECLSTLAN